MSLIVEAVFENGMLRPLEHLDLAEHQHVRLIVEVPQPAHDSTDRDYGKDPLAGLRIASGLGDLAENFDDYRFERRGK